MRNATLGVRGCTAAISFGFGNFVFVAHSGPSLPKILRGEPGVDAKRGSDESKWCSFLFARALY